MSRCGERAFTLIELVIVISIIGILAAVAIPRFIDIRAQAYNAQSNGVISAVRSGILLVASRNQVLLAAEQGAGTFPPNLEAGWGTGNPVPGTPLSSAGTDCLPATPCFELIIAGGYSDEGGRWEQTLADGSRYTFTPPAGLTGALTRICNYSSANGTFFSATVTDNCP